MATEEIRGIPFDSRLQIAEDGTQYEDREVFSADIAKYFGHISSDGICIPRGEALGDDLKVDPSTDGQVIINTGSIKIQGHMGWVDEQITKQLEAGGSKPRYDTIAIELNLNTPERRFLFTIIQGEEADEPIPPELTRTANVYQLGLADVYRVANSTVIGTITDTREDTTRCGVSQVNAPFGVLEISDGGTGATTVAGARNALGLGNTSGALPIANGGTGKTTALEALLALGGIQIKKVWENASPTSEFAGQTINLTLSEYEAVMVTARRTNESAILDTALIPVGTGGVGFTNSFITGISGKIYAYYRSARIADELTGIIFSNAFYTTPSTDIQNNNAVIPIAIYVIKGVQ